jgi:trehalose 6-phosphate phosphatase
MPIATRSAAKRNESVRTGSRCCSAVPPNAPHAAGMPTSAAYAGSTWPCTTYVITPAVAVMPIAASEVAVAERISQPPVRMSSGTITMPPPTPKSALKKPAVSPMRISRTGTRLCYELVEAHALLARLTSAPGETGIFLDFDGVLAPIVARPDDAYPPEEARAELRRLAARYALVAVVSGRAGDDVRARVGVEGIVYVGSHGLELDPDAERWRQTIRDFASGASWSEHHTELKGLTISFHFRDAADERAAVRELEEIAARATDEGLVARFGRKVLEVLPPIGSNKGTAVRHLLEGASLHRALVAGDDTTDIDAFRAVDDMTYAVRVAVMSGESPDVLREYADIVVDSTDEFLELLRGL